MSPLAPSISSSPNSEDLRKFLSNIENRKLYNKTFGLCKKFHNFRAKTNFLEQCLLEKVVPATFKINNSLEKKERSCLSGN